MSEEKQKPGETNEEKFEEAIKEVTGTAEEEEKTKAEETEPESAEPQKRMKMTPAGKKALAGFVVTSVTLLFVVTLLITNIVKTKQIAEMNAHLLQENTELQSELDDMVAEKVAAETDTSFDYLAIGNSITEHPAYENYWWGEWGMAATSPDKDYYHLVVDAIEDKYSENTTQVLNYTIWEQPYYERKDALKYLDGYLNEDLDLVTVQLGENATEYDDLEGDYEDLINYIEEKAPKARILLIGQFWASEEKDEAKQKACQNTDAVFIDLSEIQGSEYRVGTGTVVEGADGMKHKITYGPVGEHPNDEAMSFIADAIIEKMNL